MCFVGKGAAAREAIVDFTDKIRVGQGLAAELGWQLDGEVAEITERSTNIDTGGGLVEEHAEEGLRGAGILDGLGSEEDGACGVVVEGAVEGAVDGGVGAVGWVLEEEDDAVEGLERCELRGVEGEEFFELDVFDAEVFNE